jgi:hypothetical protein
LSTPQIGADARGGREAPGLVPAIVLPVVPVVLAIIAVVLAPVLAPVTIILASVGAATRGEGDTHGEGQQDDEGDGFDAWFHWFSSVWFG